MNIPNALTIFRLILVPVFIFLYGNGQNADTCFLAAIVFALASLTDILDGYLARKFNLITDFGKLADPFADKLMQLSALTCLTISGRIDFWILVLFLIKEITMIIGGLRLLKQNFVVQSKLGGKVATVVLFMCVMTMLIFDENTFPKRYANLIMISAIVFTMLAFIDYFMTYVKFNKKSKNTSDNKENM